jgi:undecaprenyl-diphosphatase
MPNFDLSVLNYIQTNIRCTALDVIMPIITKLGDGGMIWILFSLTLLIVPKTRKTGAVMAASLLLEAFCCNSILKPLIGRSRPFAVNSSIQLLIPKPGGFSFPSGHTGASFAAAASLYFTGSRLWVPSLILAIFIAFSRLYLYVHYPTDVIAGTVLGIFSGWLGNKLIVHLSSAK